MSKAGRNDPCPCGSGKKYKKCCGAKSPVTRKTIEATKIAPSSQGLFQMVKQAGELHQMNKEDAEKKRREKEKQKQDEKKIEHYKEEKSEKEKQHGEDKPSQGPPEHISPPPTEKQKGGW